MDVKGGVGDHEIEAIYFWASSQSRQRLVILPCLMASNKAIRRHSVRDNLR